MGDVCTDGRFDLIERFKRDLVEATNIETSPEEMAVLDSILFRMWQMGWLDRLEQPPASPWHRVEEELPEPIHPTDPRYKAYLICDSLGYMHVADYTYSKHFPTCYSFHVNGEEETDVKYWMPLPEPPKEGV